MSEKTGRTIIGNKSASGTAILDELGEEEIKTGHMIVYTSADSVLQICGTVNINDDGSKSTYAGIRPSDSSNYTSYFTTCQVYKKTGVFNDEIIDQTAPLIYGVGSWSVQSI